MIEFSAIGSLVIFAVADQLSTLSARQYLGFALYFGLSTCFFMLGHGLRHFRCWARFASPPAASSKQPTRSGVR